MHRSTFHQHVTSNKDQERQSFGPKARGTNAALIRVLANAAPTGVETLLSGVGSFENFRITRHSRRLALFSSSRNVLSAVRATTSFYRPFRRPWHVSRHDNRRLGRTTRVSLTQSLRHEIKSAQLLTAMCTPTLSARSRLARSTSRFSRWSSTYAVRTSGRTNAPGYKHQHALTPVKLLALRIDVFHVKNILEQHTRHLADAWSHRALSPNGRESASFLPRTRRHVYRGATCSRTGTWIN